MGSEEAPPRGRARTYKNCRLCEWGGLLATTEELEQSQRNQTGASPLCPPAPPQGLPKEEDQRDAAGSTGGDIFLSLSSPFPLFFPKRVTRDMSR